MPSRQALYLRRQSLEHLRSLADPLPVIVGHDGTRFTVALLHAPAAPVFRGRLEVVAAWLLGFRHGAQAMVDRLA